MFEQDQENRVLSENGFVNQRINCNQYTYNIIVHKMYYYSFYIRVVEFLQKVVHI